MKKRVMSPTTVVRALVDLEDALAVVEGGEVAGVDLLEHALARQVLLLLWRRVEVGGFVRKGTGGQRAQESVP